MNSRGWAYAILIVGIILIIVGILREIDVFTFVPKWITIVGGIMGGFATFIAILYLYMDSKRKDETEALLKSTN